LYQVRANQTTTRNLGSSIVKMEYTQFRFLQKAKLISFSQNIKLQIYCTVPHIKNTPFLLGFSGNSENSRETLHNFTVLDETLVSVSARSGHFRSEGMKPAPTENQAMSQKSANMARRLFAAAGRDGRRVTGDENSVRNNSQTKAPSAAQSPVENPVLCGTEVMHKEGKKEKETFPPHTHL